MVAQRGPVERPLSWLDKQRLQTGLLHVVAPLTTQTTCSRFAPIRWHSDLGIAKCPEIRTLSRI